MPDKKPLVYLDIWWASVDNEIVDSVKGGGIMDERGQRYYHSLYEAAAVVNSVRTPEDVLRGIVQNVAEALDARGCGLMLLTPDRSPWLHIALMG